MTQRIGSRPDPAPPAQDLLGQGGRQVVQEQQGVRSKRALGQRSVADERDGRPARITVGPVIGQHAQEVVALAVARDDALLRRPAVGDGGLDVPIEIGVVELVRDVAERPPTVAGDEVEEAAEEIAEAELEESAAAIEGLAEASPSPLADQD